MRAFLLGVYVVLDLETHDDRRLAVYSGYWRRPPNKSPKVAAYFAGARLVADMTPDARSKSSMTLAWMDEHWGISAAQH